MLDLMGYTGVFWGPSTDEQGSVHTVSCADPVLCPVTAAVLVCFVSFHFLKAGLVGQRWGLQDFRAAVDEVYLPVGEWPA